MLLVILMVMSLFPMAAFAAVVHNPVFVQNCDLGFHHGNTNGGPSVTKGILPNGYTKKQGEAFAQTEDPGYWLLVYPGVDENGDPVLDGNGKQVYLLPGVEEEDVNGIKVYPAYTYECPTCGRTDWVSYSNMSSGDFATTFSGKICRFVIIGGTIMAA